MLIVGSKSLVYNFPFLKREIKDIDIIGNKMDVEYLTRLLNPSSVTENEYIVSLSGIEKTEVFNTNQVEILLSDNSNSLKEYTKYDSSENEIKYASPEVIFSLKKSHINFPIKFNKHIEDYCFLSDTLGGEDKLSSITKLNYKETEDRLGKLKTPSLNKSVKEFFNQSDKYVKSYFIHDHIHLVVAHYDRPLYEKMQYDLLIAKCEEKLWDKFTFEEKCKCVLEEVYVIALERKIIPLIFGGGKYHSSLEAFNWALMRVCTTLCSGWFRQFATDNYFRIKEFYSPKYVEDFLLKYNSGDIKRV